MSVRNALPDAAEAGMGRRQIPATLLLLRGPDALGFVQRLCAQDVAGLAAGQCRWAAFLNPKGRLLATCLVGREGDDLWLAARGVQGATLCELLERYHFTENLAIDVQRELPCVEALGVGAAAAVGAQPGDFALVGGVRSFAVRRHGIDAVRAFGAAPWSALPAWSDAQAEYLRIRMGEPLVGIDTDASTLVLEAGLDDHLSTTKGCYTGQEIVARIHTYGHLNRKLCLLAIDGDAAFAPGTALVEPDEGEPVGRAMSSAPVPGSAQRVALGYLPHAFWTEGSELRVGARDGAGARVVAFG
jgi:hypothetical protein